MLRKRTGNTDWTVFKLDMAKAYDQMEWDFLKGMLATLGDKMRANGD